MAYRPLASLTRLLKEHFDYRDGHLFWIKPTNNRVKAGHQFGSYDNYGYRVGGFNGKVYKEHRLIWLYHYKTWPKECIDHINGNPGDNRIENLEWCNHSLNNIHALDNKLRNTAGKLNRSDIKKIKELKNTGITNLEISYKTKFSEAIIQGVTSGTTYKKYIRD